MKTLEQLKLELSSVENEMDKYKEGYFKYRKFADEYTSVKKAISEIELNNKKNDIILATDFQECTYPGMGRLGENGSCYLINEEVGKTLVNILKERSYTYGYVLKYSGPGEYIVEPSYSHDHDRDIIYTATIKKEENNE